MQSDAGEVPDLCAYSITVDLQQPATMSEPVTRSSSLGSSAQDSVDQQARACCAAQDVACSMPPEQHGSAGMLLPDAALWPTACIAGSHLQLLPGQLPLRTARGAAGMLPLALAG